MPYFRWLWTPPGHEPVNAGKGLPQAGTVALERFFCKAQFHIKLTLFSCVNGAVG